jgi:PIN domain nuclease of toxin-antitoxin system
MRVTICSLRVSDGMLNLDTHVLLHVINGQVTSQEHRVLKRDPDWGISAIVLWEIEKLHQRNRIEYGLSHPPLARSIRRLHVWPLAVEVCSNLRALDFTSDPADELIAATSYTYGVPLVTRDAKIRCSRVVRCLPED